MNATILDAARRYLDNGWSPIPLPANKKWPPPNGVTGWRGKYTTNTDLERPDWTWANIAIRLPADVIGIDVDVYAGGDTSFADLKAHHGELPVTTWSTSRVDGSGIALYRVPNGTVLATDPAIGIDIIQAHHRYVVCAPSIHPDGRRYEWLDELSMESIDSPPEPFELPALPWAWIELLSVDKSGAANAATPQAADTFLSAHTTATNPKALDGIRTRLAQVTKGGRHDALVSTACWAMREAAAGLYTADEAVTVLHNWWIAVVSDDPHRRESGEFGGAILWAIGQATDEPERVADIRDKAAATFTVKPSQPPPTVDPATGEIIATDGRNLPDNFWNARPELAHIRQAAHSRARSSDAVLAAVLARICATIPPNIRLPPIVGSAASLNILAALIGTSGSGKTTSADLAKELVPIDRRDVVADLPLGSGEGLAEQYFEWVNEEQPNGKDKLVKRKTKNGLYMHLDEGQALGEMGNRKGATLLPTLRSGWSGATLGSSNASAETHRVVPAHTYRLAVTVGFQVEYAKGLLDDAAGGTPQRFIFASAVDPSIPDLPPGWPGLLPQWLPATSGDPLIDVDVAIAAEIRERDLAKTRGQLVVDPLDSHRDLVRLKIGALLGWLDGRLEVNRDDWELAGMVMRASVAVRSWVAEAAREKAATDEMASHKRAATREVVIVNAVERRAIDQAARAVGKKVWRHPDTPQKRSDLSDAIAGRIRKLVDVDEAITEAERLQWITPQDNAAWVPGKAKPA